MLLLHFSVSYQHLPQPLYGHLISYNSLSQYRSLLSHHSHRIATLTTLWGRAFVPILQIRGQAQRDQLAEVESDLLQPELQGLLPSKMSAVNYLSPTPPQLIRENPDYLFTSHPLDSQAFPHFPPPLITGTSQTLQMLLPRPGMPFPPSMLWIHPPRFKCPLIHPNA